MRAGSRCGRAQVCALEGWRGWAGSSECDREVGGGGKHDSLWHCMRKIASWCGHEQRLSLVRPSSSERNYVVNAARTTTSHRCRLSSQVE